MIVRGQCYSDVIINGGDAAGRHHRPLHCVADLVVVDCETCKRQIGMSTSKRCEHPITLLVKVLR